MTKIERVRAVLAGVPVDRPPFTIWYHFGAQHAPGERTAQVHLEFFEAYDLDLLKVMNDYDYPMPEGLDVIASPTDLERLGPLDLALTPFAQQLRAIELIAAALRGRALFFDTVFNAWNTVKRNLVREAMPALMADHPRALERALATVNANLIRYARASLERGTTGLFFSVPATEESVTREQYERFMRPYDLELLEAVRGLGECHVLHAHGERLYLDRLLDYPVQALSWADQASGPSLTEVRRRTPLVLVGGLDHTKLAYVSATATRERIRHVLAEAGRTGFILAPGCAVPTYCFPPLIRAARAAARG